MRLSRSRVGFTLIEVMAAIVLSGLAVSAGVLLFRQLEDETMRIRRQGALVSRTGNGERLLRELLRNAESSIDTTERFRGDEHSATYRSWCAVPSGWLERCDVLLAIDHRPDTSAILVQLSTGERLVVDSRPGPIELMYFDLLGRDSVWVKRWGESLILPGAIAFVAANDTLILPVGASRD
jgi:prepilin-type N-terminal cleavage/methylation domain-containing protein